MKAKASLFLLVAAFLVSCGKGPIHIDPGVGQPAKLVIFGAEWCQECKADLPKLQAGLREKLGEAYALVEVELWVPTGKSPSEPPTADGPENYRKFLQLNGRAFPDGEVNKKPVRWPKFVQLFPGVPRALPAAVVYKGDGSLYKKFAPGADSFHPADIVATVAEAVGR
jgi:hypothetical protein